MDSHNRPHISYLRDDYITLRYAHFDGAAWHVETIDTAAVIGTSLALDSAGHPHIAYRPKYAHWDGSAWSRVDISKTGSYPSLRLDSAERPVISFYDDMIKLSRFDGLGWQTEVVDTQGPGAGFTSLGLDAQGRAHIAYRATLPSYALKYARGDPRVRLDLQINQPDFHTGNTLILNATVTPGGTPLTADAYVAAKLPSGSLLFLQGDGSINSEVRPLVRSWPVSPFAGEIFRYTFNGGAPPGVYAWEAAFTYRFDEVGFPGTVGAVCVTARTDEVIAWLGRTLNYTHWNSMI